MELDINAALPANLRSTRERMRISLEEASRLTGVSKSMLGQIERGEVSPTINVLWKISTGLKIPYTHLLMNAPQQIQVVRGESITPLKGEEGYWNFPVFAFSESRRFEIYRIQVEAGAIHHADAHLPGSEEYLTVFSGQLVVGVNKEEHHLHQGDSLKMPAYYPHFYQNPGNETTQVSMVIYYGEPQQ